MKRWLIALLALDAVLLAFTLTLIAPAYTAYEAVEARGYKLASCSSPELRIEPQQDYYRVYERWLTVYKLWDCITSDCTIRNEFYNWDFTSKLDQITNNIPNQYLTKLVNKWYCDSTTYAYICGECEREKVDWPINMVFYGPNLNYDKVFSTLCGVLGDCWGTWNYRFKSSMYMFLKAWNKTSWEWDEEGGYKTKRDSFSAFGYTYSCTGLSSSYSYIHVRIYAPLPKDGASDGQRAFTSPNSVVTYLIASAHIDKDEGSDVGASGWSECAEKFIADAFGAKGYYVARNYWYWYNGVDYNGVAIGLHSVVYADYCGSPYVLEDKLYHVYLNNGNATYIYIG